MVTGLDVPKQTRSRTPALGKARVATTTQVYVQWGQADWSATLKSNSLAGPPLQSGHRAGPATPHRPIEHSSHACFIAFERPADNRDLGCPKKGISHHSVAVNQQRRRRLLPR